MGWNTALLILNDAQDQIARDPKAFWEKVSSEQHNALRKPSTFGFGNHANGFTVISNRHADTTVVVAIGGNYATILHEFYSGNTSHHTEEDKLRIVRAMADQLGYKLVPTGIPSEPMPDRWPQGRW